MKPLALAGACLLLALCAPPPLSAQPAPVVPDSPAATAPTVVPAAPGPAPGALPTTPNLPKEEGEFVAPTAAAPVSPAQPTLTRSDYQVRVREMEERIVALKESIYGTKTRLALLKERILANVVSEAWVVIVHKNEMGSSFSLEMVNYLIDGGAKQFFRENKDGFLDKQETVQAYSGALAPGNHTLAVELVYRGNSSVFTYVQGYKFQIKATYDFSSVQGKILYIEAVGYEKGGFTTSMEERPAVQFKVKEYPFNRETLNQLTGQKGDGQ